MRTPRKAIGPGIGTRCKHALFVEDAVIRQVGLEAHGLDAAVVEQRIGVVGRAVLDEGQADEQRRAAVGGVARDILAGGAAGLEKGRLQHQILGRIAGDEQLGKHNDISAEGRGLGARGADRRDIAGDVADRAVDLGEADDEAVGDHAREGRRDGHPIEILPSYLSLNRRMVVKNAPSCFQPLCGELTAKALQDVPLRIISRCFT